jgi:translation initiation factor 5A
MAEKVMKKAGQLKEGQYVLIDGEVCRVKSVEISVPGRHGSAKAKITGVGVFDDKKRVILKPSGDEVEVPIIERGNAQLVAILGDTMQIMDLETYQTYDIPLQPELGELKSGDELEFMRYGNKIKIIRKK